LSEKLSKEIVQENELENDGGGENRGDSRR